MELDNQAAKKTYIVLLSDTLRKKLEVLNRLMQLTKQQEELVAKTDFAIDDFLDIVSSKDEQIKKLSELDDGFETLFNRVRDELITGKDKYASEILSLKDLIGKITDIGVNLQALEKRNKAKMEVYFSDKRKDIRRSRISSQTATNYYKTMTKQHEAQSYFFDKKN